MDPKLLAALQKLEADILADLKATVVPGVIAEVIAMSPVVVKPIESLVFAAIQSQMQAAWENLLSKVPQIK